MEATQTPCMQTITCTTPNFFNTTPLPYELAFLIFSTLPLPSLAASCLVNREWNQLASQPAVRKAVIYQQLACGNDTWARHFGADVVKDEDREEELSSLPLETVIREYKKMGKNNLLLVRLPKTLNGKLTLNSIGELFKKYFPTNETGYLGYTSSIAAKLGDQSILESSWNLWVKDGLSESQQLPYDQQKIMVANFSEKAGYVVPSTLECVGGMLAQYLRYRNFPSSKDLPYSFVRTDDEVGGRRVIAGDFLGEGFVICHNTNDNPAIGIGVGAFLRLSNQTDHKEV